MRERGNDVPTGFSLMMLSVLVFASAIAIAVTEVVVKNLRRNEILGNVLMVSSV
jgi:hypothetical protein